MLIANKADQMAADGKPVSIPAQQESLRTALGAPAHMPVWVMSCRTREGVDAFLQQLEKAVGESFAEEAEADCEAPLITRKRHRGHVEACLQALHASLDRGLSMDLAAEEMRIASRELGKITGAVDVEELLDVIFTDFCIGK